jgi:hypothetical protein
MACFACNASIELASGERVGFRDTCSACDADLHACRNCDHHDPSAHNQCRESNAEWVSDRERANYCDYFTLGDRAGGAAESAKKGTLSELDRLFKKS